MKNECLEEINKSLKLEQDYNLLCDGLKGLVIRFKELNPNLKREDMFNDIIAYSILVGMKKQYLKEK